MSTPDLKARSPWSALNDVDNVTIHPLNGKAVSVDMTVPGSKSFTNRALILAALAEGTSTLSGLLKSDDSYWCLDALEKLGVSSRVTGDTVEIDGCGGSWPVKEADLYIGAAGTIARFLPGAIAAAEGGSYRIEASRRMSERPVKPLMEALEQLGAQIEYEGKKGFYPLVIKPSGLHGGEVSISGAVSSQFISGLLISGANQQNDLTVNIPDHIVQHAYVKITLDLMKEFGVNSVYNDELTKMTVPASGYKARDMALEADASTASYFMALAAISGGRVRINNLPTETNQPDIGMVDLYEKMGCTVEKGETYVEVQGPEQLKGGLDISMKEMSDQTLTIAAIAPFADGPVTLRDVEHIRHHESDRIHAICTELGKLGIKTDEFADGLTVYPGTPKGTPLLSYDDHRVAMALSLVGAKVPDVTIADPGCVSKTCPSYFELLKAAGVDITYS